MTTPVPLSPDQIQSLLAQLLAQLGPVSAGEGFPNPVAQMFQAGNTVVIDDKGIWLYNGDTTTFPIIQIRPDLQAILIYAA